MHVFNHSFVISKHSLCHLILVVYKLYYDIRMLLLNVQVHTVL